MQGFLAQVIWLMISGKHQQYLLVRGDPPRVLAGYLTSTRPV